MTRLRTLIAECLLRLAMLVVPARSKEGKALARLAAEYLAAIR